MLKSQCVKFLASLCFESNRRLRRSARFASVLAAICAVVAPSLAGASLASPVATMSFSPSSVYVGTSDPSEMTITLTNPNPQQVTGVAFSDNYPGPGAFLNLNSNVTANTCGGATQVSQNTSTFNLSGGVIPGNGSCAVTLAVWGFTAGAWTNTTSTITSANASDGSAATGTLTVNLFAAPTATKTFDPPNIAAGGTSQMRITLSNPNVSDVTSAQISDSYPSGLSNVASNDIVFNTCGGDLTAAANFTSAFLGNATIPANGSCSFAINVTAASASTLTNTTGTVLSSNAESGMPASAVLTASGGGLLSTPVISEVFNPATISVGGESTLVVTLINQNAQAIAGLQFHETLASGIVNAGGGAIVSNTCGGTLAAPDNGAFIDLINGTIAGGGAGTCAVTIKVVGIAQGQIDQPTGPVWSANAQAALSADGFLNVSGQPALAAPTLAKAFSPSTIQVGQTAQMSITLTNPNALAIVGLHVNDIYPSGIENAPNSALVSNSCGGTVSPLSYGFSGTDALFESDGIVPANGSCSIVVNVVGTEISNAIVNTVQAVSNNAAAPNNATATLTVTPEAPVASEDFEPPTVSLGGISTMAITIENDNVQTMTGVGFSDTYLPGIVNLDSGSGIVSSNSCGGSIAAAANGNSLTLSGGSIAPHASCEVDIAVVSTQTGTIHNNTGPIANADGAPPGANAQGTLTVSPGALIAAPKVVKSFLPSSVSAGGTSQMTITLTNTNGQNITGVEFTDAYPPGIKNAADPVSGTSVVVSNTCGGVAIADINSTSATLNQGLVPSYGSCSIVVNVAGATTATNQTGQVFSANATPGASASAQLTVVPTPLLNAPTVTKAFSPSGVTLGDTSMMTITLSNTNATDIVGAQFNDIYPQGLANADAGNGSSVVTNSCGGTVDADVNGHSAALVNGTIPKSGSCSVVVEVVATQVGSLLNQTGKIPSANAQSGNAFSAILSVASGAALVAPGVTKSFFPNFVSHGGTSQMTISLANANSLAVVGATFNDTYPAGITNDNSGAPLVNTCGGTVTMTAGGSTLGLSGGIIPPNNSCEIVVNVVGATVGTWLNKTGLVQSTNAPPAAQATAQLLVNHNFLLGAPTITKTFVPTTAQIGQTTEMTIAIANSDPTKAITFAQFIDHYPANIVNVHSGAIVNNTCGGTLKADPDASSASLIGGTVPANSSCSITIDVVAVATGAAFNQSGKVASNNAQDGASASATLQVSNVSATPDLTIAKSHVGDFTQGQVNAAYTLVVTNSGSAATSGLVTVTDVLPSGLTATEMSSQDPGWACSLATLTCTRSDALASNSSYASITLSVNVAADAGNVVNIANVSGGGESDTSNDTASDPTTIIGSSLLAAPTVSKSFVPATIVVDGTSQMTITLANNDPATAVIGAHFDDTYPAGIVNASVQPVVSNTCNGSLTIAPGGNSIQLDNGVIPAGASCAVVLDVVGSAPGNLTNHSGTVTSSNASPGSDATGSVVVQSGSLSPAPTVSKSFLPTDVVVGGTSQMTIKLTNNDASHAVVGAQFSDNYPFGIANAADNAVVTNTCGGTVAADPGVFAASLANGTIPAGGSCRVVINVVGTAVSPSIVNDTGPVASATAQTASGASATLVSSSGPLLTALTAQKSFSPDHINAGDTSLMTITLANPNASAISGAQINDLYPNGMLNDSGNPVVSDTCNFAEDVPAGASWAKLAGGTVPANGCSITIRVVGTATAQNDTGPLPAANANSGTDAFATLTINGAALGPDLTLVKTHAGHFTQGQVGATYFLSANNIGSTDSSGPVTVSDTLPPSLTATAMGGPGWNCSTATVSCSRTDSVASNHSFPAITLTVDVAANAPAGVTNTATIGGGGEVITVNDVANDPTVIDVVGAGPDLSLTKSHAGNFSQGQNGAVYSLVAHNVGNAATNGTVTVADTLPPGMTAVAISGPGWNCSLATTSCFRSNSLMQGDSYPAITLTVNVANNAPQTVTNSATIGGGGETNLANDSAIDPTTIDLASAGPDLSLTKSHVGNFTQGQTNAVYTLVVHNVGNLPTSGTTTVTDQLPPALIATTMDGSGWTCDFATATCTSTASVAAGSDYPTITLLVDVPANAPSSLTNVATVAGGGESNSSNDVAEDPTTISASGPSGTPTSITSISGTPQSTPTGQAFPLPLEVDVADASDNPVAGAVVDFTAPANGASATCAPAAPTDAGGHTQTTCIANTTAGTYQVSATISGAALSPALFDLSNTPAATNHVPVAVGDAIEVQSGHSVQTLVGDPVAPSSVLDNDFDFDGDTLTATKVSEPAHGSVSLSSDGTFNYQNNGAGTTDSFAYKACDALQCSAATTVTITIGDNLDDHVPFAVGDAIEVARNQSTNKVVGDPNVPGSLLYNDVDPDQGDALTASQLTSPTHGDLSAFHADGTFSYQNTDPLATTDGFLYEACDHEGACDLGFVTITIGDNLSDHPPAVVDDAIQVSPNPPGNVTNALIGDLIVPSSVLDNDSDQDAGDTLTATKISGLLNASGSIEFNSIDGTFTYTYTNPMVSTDSFLYEACDREGACTPGLVNIGVTSAPVDLPPIAEDDAMSVAPHGATSSLVGDANVPNSVLDNDSDPDGPHSALTANLVSPPSNGDVTLHADGTFVYTNQTPLPDAFQYEVCDASQACVSATVSVTINNAAPTVTCTLTKQIDSVGDSVNIDLSQLFAPPPGQASLIYSVMNPPPSLLVNGAFLTGSLTAAGLYSTTQLVATVPGGASASENVVFQVLPDGELIFRNGFDNSTQTPPLVCQ